MYRGSEKEKIIIGGVRKIFTHEKDETADKRRAQHQRYKGRNDGGRGGLKDSKRLAWRTHGVLTED